MDELQGLGGWHDFLACQTVAVLQYIRIFAASIIAPAGTPGGPCRRSQPVEAPPPRGPALELGSSEQLCPKCMYACTCCTPVPHPRYALPHVPKKNRKKEQRAKTSEKKTEQPIFRCFVVPCSPLDSACRLVLRGPELQPAWEHCSSKTSSRHAKPA